MYSRHVSPLTVCIQRCSGESVTGSNSSSHLLLFLATDLVQDSILEADQEGENVEAGDMN